MSLVYSAYSRQMRCNQLLGNKVISTHPDCCKHIIKNSYSSNGSKRNVGTFFSTSSTTDYLGFKCAPDAPATAQSTIQEYGAVFTALKLLWNTEWQKCLFKNVKIKKDFINISKILLDITAYYDLSRCLTPSETILQLHQVQISVLLSPLASARLL